MGLNSGPNSTLYYQLVLASLSPVQVPHPLLLQQAQQIQDWEALIQLSLQSAILPLLSRRLTSLPANSLPPSVSLRLHDLSQLIALRNLRLSKLLVQVIDLLQSHGIQSLAYKGPAVSLQAYGDLTLRQFTDLDLLIHPQDFPKTYHLLVQAGFVPHTPLTPAQRPLLVNTGFEFTFHHQSDILEIHWDLSLPDFLHPLRTSAFWETAIPIEILNRLVMTLSPQNAVFFTCLHATKHAWESLKWLADLAHYTQSYPHLDWLAMLEFAHQNGFHRLVCLSLLLAEQLAGASIPPPVSQHIASEPQSQLLAQEVSAHITTPQPLSSGSSQLYFFFRSRERLRDRLYIIFAQLFAPRETDWRTFPLPAPLFPLYYLLRPLRVLIKSLGLILARIIQ